MSKTPQTGAESGRKGGGFHGRRIESPRDFRKAIKRLIAYIGAQSLLILIAGVFVLAGVVLRVIAPAVIGTAIKKYLEQGPDLDKFLEQITFTLVLYVAAWAASALSGIALTRISNQIIFRIRSQIFDHLQVLSMSFFDKRGIGDIISRVTNDIEMIYNALSNGVVSLLNAVFTIIGVLIAMFVMSWQLSLVVIAVIPFMLLAAVIIGKKVREAYRKNQAQIGALNANIQEAITGIRVIKCFHREEEEFRQFREINAGARDVGIKAEFTSQLFMPLMLFLTSLALSALVAVGGTLITLYHGIFSIGLLSSFILYTNNFFQPLRQITQVYNIIQSALAGAERVFDVMETQPDIISSGNAVALEEVRGDVKFRNVSFHYVENKPVLEDISFEVAEGQTIAIVGPTGAGKTTMINLLSRFYDVTEGSILVDGYDIRELEIHSLRSRMGIVLQEPFFFATTIRENLKYSNLQATDEEMIRAACHANADAFIRRLPGGYDTVLTERGMNLSQGERQLLGIARVILADPRILILDEATSNIDSLTEAHIQKALEILMKGRTSFIIAHRLSTVKNADRVFVIHNHRIIESGTHEELMSRQGFYFRLYNMQLRQVDITEEMAI